MYFLSMLYSMLFVNETILAEHCLEPGNYTFDTFNYSIGHPGRDICLGNTSTPYLYPRDNISKWRFDVPFSNIGFRLHAIDFSLPVRNNDTCKDYLMVNGVNKTLNNKTLCGTDGCALNPSWSWGSELNIDFHSAETLDPANGEGNYTFLMHISPYGICNGTIQVPDSGEGHLAFNPDIELYQNIVGMYTCTWNITGPAEFDALDIERINCTSDELQFRYKEQRVDKVMHPCRDPHEQVTRYNTTQMEVVLPLSKSRNIGEFSFVLRASHSSSVTSATNLPSDTPTSASMQTTGTRKTSFPTGSPATSHPPPSSTLRSSITPAESPTTPFSNETTTEFLTITKSTSTTDDQFTGSSETEASAGATGTSPTFAPTVHSTSNYPDLAPHTLHTTPVPGPGVDPVMTHIPNGTTGNLSTGQSKDMVLVIIGVLLTVLLFLIGAVCICRYRRKWLLMVEELKVKCNQMGWQQSTSTAPVFIPLPKECEPYIIHPRQLKKSETFLGKGEHGLVYKGSALGLLGKNGATDVAVKTLLVSGSTANPASTAKFVKEVAVMLQTGQHLNLVNLLGVINRGRPCMLLEYCEHGNLLSYLRDCHSSHLYDPSELTISSYLEINVEKVDLNTQPGQRVFDTSELIKFAYQIARGMQYLASRSIVHRDLAARNVLVAQHNILKISDFGMAKQIESVYVAQDGSAALPIRWMPPEAITTLSFSLASDVWSYGIVLWEIFTQGKVPYAEITITGQIKVFNQWLLDGNVLSKPADTPDTIYQLMKACWNLHPEKRPSFFDIRKYLDKSISKQAVASYLQLDAPYEYMNLVNQEMHIKLYHNTQTDTVL